MTPFVSHLRGRAGARGSTPRQSRRFYLPEDVAALITGGAFIPHRAAREPGLGWRAWSRVTGLAPTSGPAVLATLTQSAVAALVTVLIGLAALALSGARSGQRRDPDP